MWFPHVFPCLPNIYSSYTAFFFLQFFGIEVPNPLDGSHRAHNGNEPLQCQVENACAEGFCELGILSPESEVVAINLEICSDDMDPPSNFSYEMGRTWATVQIASQDFVVQTGGVVPRILYLESFCS